MIRWGRLEARSLAGAICLLALFSGCARVSPEPLASVGWADYWPDRHDYTAFQAHHPDVLEPNYLPFMVHRVPLGGPAGDALIFCRWPAERFPLAVYVDPPEIPAALQDEFHPKPPEHYVTAVRAALETWERNLEGLVRFRYVDGADEADVHVQLIGEVGPAAESDVRVLGATPLGGACRVHPTARPGAAAEREGEAGRLSAEFEVSSFRVFVADETGLLEPDQVERLALHETGHLLGMSRHSPIPGDLMFEVARDRPLGEALSNEDVNSFLSLYRIANGTIFLHSGPAGGDTPDRGLSRPAGSEPVLAMAPHVDARFGYEIRLPRAWTRIETSHGVIAVHGVAWDYDASFQVIVRRYPSVESYLGRYSHAYLAGGEIVDQQPLEHAGRRGLRWIVRDRVPGVTEHLSFLEAGENRLFVVIADCVNESFAAYRPWFEAVVASLELWDEAPSSRVGE